MRIAMTTASIGMAIVSIALFAAEPASAPPKSRTYSVSVSQHVDITDPLDDQQVRDILAGASDLLQKRKCNITFTLKGDVGSFGEHRGPLLSLNTSEEIETVHKINADPNANLHIKIVKEIKDFCRGASNGSTFNGCAWPIDFRSIIVIRDPKGGNPLGDDRRPLSSFVWAHEFGHLMGLRHSLASNALMTPCPIKKTDKVVTEQECLCYLSGPGTSPNGLCDLEPVLCPSPN